MTERAEVVIAGGGVIGTSIAFHLAKLGLTDVILLERVHLASGSTGRSVGNIETAYATDVNVVLAKLGYEELSRFPEATGATAEFHPRRYLETVRDVRHRELLERKDRVRRAHGLHPRILEPREILEIFPEMRTDDVAGALLVEEAGFCDPTSVARGYAAAAKGLGGGGQAGSPAGRPMYSDLTARFYFRQELDGGFVLGLVEDVAADDLANPETDWTFKIRAVEAAVHRVPKLVDTSVANGWSGVVTFTPDQLPGLGPVDSPKGYYLANGMSGDGGVISPAVG